MRSKNKLKGVSEKIKKEIEITKNRCDKKIKALSQLEQDLLIDRDKALIKAYNSKSGIIQEELANIVGLTIQSVSWIIKKG